MRQNKWIILLVSPLTATALLLAWVLDFLGNTFFSNVMLGIFGSGLLTVMASIVNYHTERRKVLESFWSYGHKAISNLNRYSADDNLDTAIDVLLQMKEFDYQPFDDAYGDICFLFHNKKLREEITRRIYAPIMEVRNIISDKSFHFALYKKSSDGNRYVMGKFVQEIDKLLIERKEHIIPQEDGEPFIITDTNTYKVHNLLLEFNNYYYWIMYPWQKKEMHENAD